MIPEPPSQRRDKMRLVHRDGVETPLEQMAGRARAGVEERRVAPMRLADSAREPRRRSRREDEMNVVGHESIGPAGCRIRLAALGHEVAVERMVA